MKRKPILLLTLTICAFTLPIIARQAASDLALKSFWKKFKTAVISGNKHIVSNLSEFPVGMSYGIPRIRNRSDLLRRYQKVFSEQTDAAKCFDTKEPELESAKPTRATVACPNSAGHEVVIYQFRLTRTGWKFVGLDNINE